MVRLPEGPMEVQPGLLRLWNRRVKTILIRAGISCRGRATDLQWDHIQIHIVRSSRRRGRCRARSPQRLGAGRRLQAEGQYHEVMIRWATSIFSIRMCAFSLSSNRTSGMRVLVL